MPNSLLTSEKYGPITLERYADDDELLDNTEGLPLSCTVEIRIDYGEQSGREYIGLEDFHPTVYFVLISIDSVHVEQVYKAVNS